MTEELLVRVAHRFKQSFLVDEEIDYPAIFRSIFRHEIDREQLDLLLQFLAELEKILSDEGHKRLIRKMRRHFLLSYEQKVAFLASEKNLQKIVEKFDEEVDKRVQSLEIEVGRVQFELSNQLAVIDSQREAQVRLTEQLKDFESHLSRIYTQFVTILGIFTAIVLSIFGGLQLITSTFDELHELPVWKATLMASLVAIAVLCMLGLLTRWISSLIEARTNKVPASLFFANNGPFSVGIFIFSYMAIASIIFSSSSTRITFEQLVNTGNSLPVLTLLILPVALGAAVLIKTIDYRKFK
ncbi:hypothetical protein [Bhargavaea cecembensis]|uniref:hypothetical protein n=1 Tax=Bhargavaea cecembensis TaxID=394098 RepID=UPI0018D46BB5|nr:hypothetical protein [Bhargavaea cecembensis]